MNPSRNPTSVVSIIAPTLPTAIAVALAPRVMDADPRAGRQFLDTLTGVIGALNVPIATAFFPKPLALPFTLLTICSVRRLGARNL